MKVNIVSVGNSKGIRIPKSILDQCNFDKEAEIEVHDNKLLSKLILPTQLLERALKAVERSLREVRGRGIRRVKDGERTLAMVY